MPKALPFLTVNALLASCAEPNAMLYQGRPAATASECQSARQTFEQQQRDRAAFAIGAGYTGVARGLNEGVASSHYQACLDKVAALSQVGGVAQTQTVQDMGNGRFLKTYTYGTAPSTVATPTQQGGQSRARATAQATGIQQDTACKAGSNVIQGGRAIA